MAISRLASQDAQGTSSTASIAATYPGATTAGNLLIATVWSNASVNPAITGWTTRLGNSSGSNGFAVFDRLADGTETTVTATGGNTNGRIHIYEYTGNANPLATDGTNSGSATSAATATTASITTANANDLLFAAIVFNGSVTVPSATAPFNLQETGPGAIRLMDADQIVSATGTYSATFSWTTNQATHNIIVSYQAAAAVVTSASGSTLSLMGVG